MPPRQKYNHCAMSSLDSLLSLNEAQKRAVTAPEGQTLVLAGPGSGKTKVLTQRIAFLIHEMGVPADRILAVTFTNKAAREMESRLEKLLPEQVKGLWLGTFHANCARILRRESKYLPFSEYFVIMDADDQLGIIKKVLKELNIDDKSFRPAGVHAAISKAKNNLLTADDFPEVNYRDAVVKRVYAAYQESLRASNAVDFDDLLLETVKLLVDQPIVREKYSRMFHHVLIDEFQDTNVVQYELVKLLASHHGNLFVVGDEDQSIYRWRGADYRNVLRFEKDFPNCTKVLLEQNYRSTQRVLDAARGVIDQNNQRTAKHLFTHRGEGEKLILHEATDDRAEAEYVVETIRKGTRGNPAKGGNYAVMYRTNAQSRVLEEAFLHAGIPYRLVGAQRFYGRREVKDMIAYLRLVFNPDDEISLMRVINVPGRGIGDKTIALLLQTAHAQMKSAGQVLLDIGHEGLDTPRYAHLAGRSGLVLADFGGMLSNWRSLVQQEISLPELFDRIVKDTGYQEYLQDGTDEGFERWENVAELRRLAMEYQDRGLIAFLENLALVSDQDTLPEEAANAPTLLTLHAAKGLEFPQVFIIGLDDGILPHSRSRDDPEEMAEERRLFYVGITRAMDKLYLVRADQRTMWGGYDSQIPSQFLDDIPEKLIDRSGEHRDRWQRGVYAPTRQSGSVSFFTSFKNASDPIVEQQFHPADKVRHPIWGEGTVMDSKLRDGDENVDVFFESVGFKRLAVSLAKLEKINRDS